MEAIRPDSCIICDGRPGGCGGVIPGDMINRREDALKERVVRRPQEQREAQLGFCGTRFAYEGVAGVAAEEADKGGGGVVVQRFKGVLPEDPRQGGGRWGEEGGGGGDGAQVGRVGRCVKLLLRVGGERQFHPYLSRFVKKNGTTGEFNAVV